MFRPLSQGYQLVLGSRILGFPWEYSKTRPSGLSFNREAAADGLLNSSCRNLAELPHVLLRTRVEVNHVMGGLRRKVGWEGQWTSVFMILYNIKLTDEENGDDHQGVILFVFSIEILTPQT